MLQEKDQINSWDGFIATTHSTLCPILIGLPFTNIDYLSIIMLLWHHTGLYILIWSQAEVLVHGTREMNPVLVWMELMNLSGRLTEIYSQS